MPVNLQNGTSFVNDADPINLTVSNGRTTQVNSTHLLSSDIHPLRSRTCFNPSFINLPLRTGKEQCPVLERERAHRVELAASRVQGTTLMVSGRMRVR